MHVVCQPFAYSWKASVPGDKNDKDLLLRTVIGEHSCVC